MHTQACQKALKLFPANRGGGRGEREQEAAERLFEDNRTTCSSANRGTLKDLEGQVRKTFKQTLKQT
jgi:hypothetical protein